MSHTEIFNADDPTDTAYEPRLHFVVYHREITADIKTYPWPYSL